MAKPVTITAIKRVKGRKAVTVVETVESFGACTKRLKELATAWKQEGFTFNPTSRVDFDAVGFESGKPVVIQITAKYVEGETRIVTDRPSVILTSKVLTAA